MLVPLSMRPRTPGEYQTFVGYATPPTSYGGYGGNAEEAPKYTFEYPTGWKSEVPSKVGEEAPCQLVGASQGAKVAKGPLPVSAGPAWAGGAWAPGDLLCELLATRAITTRSTSGT